MNGIDVNQVIDSLVEARGDYREDSDYVGEDGLLYCGICKRRKETILKVEVDGTYIDRKVPCMCQCRIDEIDAENRRKAEADYKERMSAIRDASLMDLRFYEVRFDKAKKTDYNVENLKKCRNYASSFKHMLELNQGLLFWGDVGTGKSYAAACIANAVIENGYSVIMTSFVKLMDMFRDAGFEELFFKRMNEVKLVIFDDLDAERSTEYAMEKVYNIIDSRYRANLPMVVTTNLSLSEMLDESDLRYKRIYDRIFEVCYPLQWTGPSWRKLRAQERFNEMKKNLGG